MNCMHVTPPALVRLLKSCKKLWSLFLFCPNYSNNSIEELLQTLHGGLESVTIIGPNITLTVADIVDALPNLAMAQINNCFITMLKQCPACNTAVVASKQALEFLATHHIEGEEIEKVLGYSPTFFTNDVVDTNFENKNLLQILQRIPTDLHEITLVGTIFTLAFLRSLSTSLGARYQENLFVKMSN